MFKAVAVGTPRWLLPTASDDDTITAPPKTERCVPAKLPDTNNKVSLPGLSVSVPDVIATALNADAGITPAAATVGTFSRLFAATKKKSESAPKLPYLWSDCA